MTRCVVCGKHIWSALVSIPDKGDYHYECAKSAGALKFFKLDRDLVKKRAEEVLRELNQIDNKELLAQRIEDEVKLLKTWEMVIARQERERLQEKKK